MLDISIYMYYNINKLKDNTYIERLKGDLDESQEKYVQSKSNMDEK